MKLLNKDITHIQKTVSFEIEIRKDIIVNVWKYILESNYGDYDSDWGFVDDEDKAKYEKWAGEDDDKIDKFNDFIMDLTMFN